jgi:hypothetical protein
MKSKKQPALACQIDVIGASACPMAVFSGFYDCPGPPPSGDGHCIVPPHCDDHQNGHQSGYIIHRCFVCCHPGGRQGDTERVVARWWHPVASGVALDMLHQVMPHLAIQRLTMAIEMAGNRGAFIRRRRLYCLA